MSDERLPYHLGVVSAGAVTVGAYTAGVFDFLFEAWAAWEAAKAGGEDVPDHAVKLLAMSGGSAGGICSAMQTVAFARPTPPDQKSLLYKIWVEAIDLEPMLKFDRIGDPTVRSLLRSEYLEEVGQSVIDDVAGATNQASAFPSFVDEHLQVTFSLTNLHGVPYVVGQNNLTGEAAYTVHEHADYRTFVCSFGSPAPETPAVKEFMDGVTLNLQTLHTPEGRRSLNEFIQTALACGAFPVGLKTRILTRNAREYRERRVYRTNGPVLERVKTDSLIPGSFFNGKGEISMEYMDGGVMNNEPFEFVRQYLAYRCNGVRPFDRREGVGRLPRHGAEAHSGVVMVDPFPSKPRTDYGQGAPSPILKSLLHLIPAIRNQTHFSRDILAVAADDNAYSRYLLTPVRYSANGVKVPSDQPQVAGGFLHAFGGAFDVALREHDYWLGRYNCQRFLQRHFALPADNLPVFGDYSQSHDKIKRWEEAGYAHIDEKDGKTYVSVIPVKNEIRSTENGLPPAWPKMSGERFDELGKEAWERLKFVAGDLFADFGTSAWGLTALAECVTQRVARKRFLSGYWKGILKKELKNHELLHRKVKK